MSVTSKFVNAFKPDVEEHVMWLSDMCDIAENWGKVNIEAEMKKNPMKVPLEARDALDWPHIHFLPVCRVRQSGAQKSLHGNPALERYSSRVSVRIIKGRIGRQVIFHQN
jgi:hypothetical protein